MRFYGKIFMIEWALRKKMDKVFSIARRTKDKNFDGKFLEKPPV